MGTHVITIAREYGSGGRRIGMMLARELGYNYYDREIMQLASIDSGRRAFRSSGRSAR